MQILHRSHPHTCVKKFFLLGLVLAIAMLPSCEYNVIEPQQGKKESRLVAEVESLNSGAVPQTKSTIDVSDNTARFKWKDGDEIAVYTTSDIFAQYTFQNSGGRYEFVNNDGVTPQVGAIYPYSASCNSSNIGSGNITKVVLPAIYSYSDGPSTNMPMVAYLNGNRLQFKHLGGVAMFPVKNVPENAATFEFKANTNITGEFTINQPQASDSHNGTIMIGERDGSGTTVTITNFPSGDVDFYVPLPCGNYCGFELTIKDDSNAEIAHIVSSKEFTVTRASVKSFMGLVCKIQYASERDALVALYNALNGKQWANKANWCSDAPIGEWQGITVDSDGRVVEIAIINDYIRGSLYSDILGTFTELKRLKLYNMVIPNNNNLTELDVSANTKLTYLLCIGNKLTNLDVSANTQLTNLICYDNNLTNLDVSANTQLTELACQSNNLTEFDVSANTQLKNLDCSRNNLATLDVSTNTQLTSLKCFDNNLTDLDIRNIDKLRYIYTGKQKRGKIYLYMTNNQLLDWESDWCYDYYNNDVYAYTSKEELDEKIAKMNSYREALIEFYNATGGDQWTKKTNWCSEEDLSLWYGLTFTDNDLTELKLEYNNLRGELSLELMQKFPELQSLNVYSNYISAINVSANTHLTELICNYSSVTDLDISGCTNLTELNCAGNNLTAIDVSANTQLIKFDCYKNNLTELNLSSCTQLTSLDCSDNSITNLDIRNNEVLEKVSVGRQKSGTLYFYMTNNQLSMWERERYEFDNSNVFGYTSIEELNQKLAKINDYKEALIALYDATGGDQWTEKTNWCSEKDLSLWYGLKFMDDDLIGLELRNNNLQGTLSLELMQKFPELQTLDVSGNEISAIDVSTNTQLTNLKCNSNSLNELNVSTNTQLTNLQCSSNSLDKLEVGSNTLLEELYCDDNCLEVLDVSANTRLKGLNCSRNGISNLTVEVNTLLETLSCGDNHLGELDVSANTQLSFLDCNGNSLDELDISTNTKLDYLDCSGNNLSKLNIRQHPRQSEYGFFFLLYVGNQKDDAVLELFLTQEQLIEWNTHHQSNPKNVRVTIDTDNAYE